jgi:hypothetical protein
MNLTEHPPGTEQNIEGRNVRFPTIATFTSIRDVSCVTGALPLTVIRVCALVGRSSADWNGPNVYITAILITLGLVLNLLLFSRVHNFKRTTVAVWTGFSLAFSAVLIAALVYVASA